MPKFAYTALDENGERVEGVMTADSQTSIRRELTDQGFRPLRVAPKSSVLQLEITKEKVSKEEVMHFSRQLSVFIKAGIPIMEALRVIGDEVTDKLMKKIIFDMIEAIYDGETFAAAAASHPEAFPNYYIGMLQSAELTGNLDGTLNQLADYMKRDIDARSKLKSALIYPAVVLCLSVVVVLILTVYVLPKFQVFFKQLNAKLPLPTRMLLDLSSFVSSYWWLLLIIVIGVVATIVVMRRNPVGRARIDEFLLRMPVLGELIRTAIIERTCRVLASMIDTGVPLPDALSVAADCANNAVYREGLDHIRSQMMEGRGLAAPLSETGLFPGAAHQMFRVGEETGTLNDQMDVAADYYGRELDVKLSNFTSLFEPAIIIGVGIVVGFVAVALVSAMYGVYNQVHV
jgi:type IV pilus assembly protein PilC